MMRRFRPRGASLRVQLLAISIVLLIVGLAASTTVVVVTLRGHLVGRVDGQLGSFALILSRLPTSMIQQNGTDARDAAGIAQLAAGAVQPTTFAARDLDLISEVYVAYVAPDGTVLRSGHSDAVRGGQEPRLPRLDTARVRRQSAGAFTVPGRGGGEWRVTALPWTPIGVGAGQSVGPGQGVGAGQSVGPGQGVGTGQGVGPGRGGSVVVAASLREVDRTTTRVGLICLVTDLGLLVLLSVAGWFAVRAGLRPLRAIERAAGDVAAGNLASRIPDPPDETTEIGRLAVALNSMFAQLEQAFAVRVDSESRMRRFVSDVSHELRTPLFGIKGFAELYRMGGLSADRDVDRAMDRIESESGRLARMAEDLLMLARMDEQAPLQLAPMDLRTLAADARHDLRALDPERSITLTGPAGAGQPGGADVVGDEARLRQVVSNLVGNVVAHTPAGSPVRIGVGTLERSAILEIADDGPGLTEEQAARVFERFYRVDGSRGRGGGAGAGLGLAIVWSFVAAHGGRVELDTRPGEGARFRIVLPAVDAR